MWAGRMPGSTLGPAWASIPQLITRCTGRTRCTDSEPPHNSAPCMHDWSTRRPLHKHRGSDVKGYRVVAEKWQQGHQGPATLRSTVRNHHVQGQGPVNDTAEVGVLVHEGNLGTL